MNTFTINGVTYKSAPINFNFMCDLEDNGISIDEAENKPMKLIRAYFAMSANIGVEEAGKLLGEHMINGGSLDELQEVFLEELDKSGFFRNAQTDKAEETPKSPKKATSK